MGIIGRVLTDLRNRRAKKLGEEAGQQFVLDTEKGWSRFKGLASSRVEKPSELNAMFMGWLYSLHGQLFEFMRAMETPEGEMQAMWTASVVQFASRLRREVLGALDDVSAESAWSAQDTDTAANDIIGMQEEFMAKRRASQDAALNTAVRAIRSAEEAGRLAVDERTDAELKESIREMWEDEQRRQRP